MAKSARFADLYALPVSMTAENRFLYNWPPKVYNNSMFDVERWMLDVQLFKLFGYLFGSAKYL
jgi:hypothetical protein